MVYKENFVVVVKVNGKILREHDDGVVTLPFGSEYSLLLKNLNSRRAVVKISVDGQDVLSGSSLIVQPNSEYPLEGFMDGFRVKGKFLFIQKTKEIQDHRGDRIDDGAIRVEYWFEKEVETRKIIHEHHEHHWDHHHHYGCDCYCYPWYPYHPTVTYGSTSDVNSWTFNSGSRGLSAGSSPVVSNKLEDNSLQSVYVNQIAAAAPLADEGITVPGGDSSQTFIPGYIGKLEENSQVIVIRLRGTKLDGNIVSQPVTVKTKLSCPTCGKRSRSNIKFCSRCGTRLVI